MLLWTPALTVAVLWWTRRFVAGAGARAFRRWCGARRQLGETRRSWLVSLKLSLQKIGSSSAACWPACRSAARGRRCRWAPASWCTRGAGCRRVGHRRHDLMVAGAAAGIAAAFNTPLGGIIFALEQLTRRRNMSHSALVISSIVLAGLVAVAVFGNNTYFGELRVQQLSGRCSAPGCWWRCWPGWRVACSRG
jgi:hypothetical protein